MRAGGARYGFLPFPPYSDSPKRNGVRRITRLAYGSADSLFQGLSEFCSPRPEPA
jgi:hypothetical protein